MFVWLMAIERNFPVIAVPFYFILLIWQKRKYKHAYNSIKESGLSQLSSKKVSFKNSLLKDGLTQSKDIVRNSV